MAHPQGVDLPTPAILGVLGVWIVVSSLFGVQWIGPATTTADVRGFVAQEALVLLLWLVLVGCLGWRKAVGLVPGRASVWGIAPLAALWAATLLSAGVAGRLSTDATLLSWLALSVFVAAFTEELAFRGFLLHGLTRRLGGLAAVFASSGLFGLIHVPGLLRDNVTGGPMALALASHVAFGVLMCRVRAETGALWCSVGIHALWNVLIITYWTFPSGDPPAAAVMMQALLGLFGLGMTLGLALRRPVAASWDAAWTQARFLAFLQHNTPRDLSHRRRPTARALRTAPVEFFERFTVPSRRALVGAQHVAATRGDDHLGTEHLLRGIIDSGDDPVCRVLQALGVPRESASTLDDVASETTSPPRLIPFTPAAKQSLVRTFYAAADLGTSSIEPIHLFLGVVRQEQAEGARALLGFGIDVGRAVDATLRILSERSRVGDEGPDDPEPTLATPPAPA